jgi:uncharacterized membrane protein
VQLSCLQSRPEFAFACVALLFGAALSLITPPFQAPDEHAHFYRAYQISDGELLGVKHRGESGGLLPVSLETVAKRFLDLAFHPAKKTTSEAIFDALSIPLERSKQKFVAFENTSPRPPIPYLPQALGIAIGKAFDLTPLMLMYLGRITNLAASALLVLIALRLIPVFKSVLVLLALMPMSTSLMASVSPDAFTNSLAFLFIAMIVRASLLEGKLDNKYVAALILLSVLLSLSKQLYFPLSLLFLLVPPHRIGSKRRYVIALILLIGISAAALAGWALFAKDVYVPLSWKSHLDPIAQLRFIAAHPVWVASMLLGHLWSGAGYYLDFMVGLRLGWVDAAIPHWFIRMYQVVLVLAALIDSRGSVRIGLRFKLTCLAVALVDVVTIATLAYIIWTPVGSSRVVIWGRYFIPMSPLLLLPFYNRTVVATLRETPLRKLEGSCWSGAPLVAFLLFSSSVTLYFVAARYYW